MAANNTVWVWGRLPRLVSFGELLAGLAFYS